MPLIETLLNAYGRFADPSKLPEWLKDEIVGRALYSQTSFFPGGDRTPYSPAARLMASGLALGSLFAAAAPAAYAAENKAENSVYRVTFGVGKSSDGSDSNATVRFLNKGFYYSVNN